MAPASSELAGVTFLLHLDALVPGESDSIANDNYYYTHARGIDALVL